ncbi:hypothetical protein M427DRAFT_41405 [Gonapodya prolifera JEL478]|uniref:F-box domain-containing protein n=1 Tax=Gonapodya prolifera (strain JEL478) TaxID=1344416 RepID=A0A139ATH3_GONPJ|nr:hypothetical protein M427DRAFT_41405 [Gonapodya prolifera JEL478]|eukprot:KXS20028.1 hypothetical protein M427DRAFT_41405 [Gonapodya prolifera JEL478]
MTSILRKLGFSIGQLDSANLKVRFDAHVPPTTAKNQPLQKSPAMHALPDELLIAIFRHVSPADLVSSVPLVCRRWSHVRATLFDASGRIPVELDVFLLPRLSDRHRRGNVIEASEEWSWRKNFYGHLKPISIGKKTTETPFAVGLIQLETPVDAFQTPQELLDAASYVLAPSAPGWSSLLRRMSNASANAAPLFLRRMSQPPPVSTLFLPVLRAVTFRSSVWGSAYPEQVLRELSTTMSAIGPPGLTIWNTDNWANLWWRSQCEQKVRDGITTLSMDLFFRDGHLDPPIAEITCAHQRLQSLQIWIPSNPTSGPSIFPSQRVVLSENLTSLDIVGAGIGHFAPKDYHPFIDAALGLFPHLKTLGSFCLLETDLWEQLSSCDDNSATYDTVRSLIFLADHVVEAHRSGAMLTSESISQCLSVVLRTFPKAEELRFRFEGWDIILDAEEGVLATTASFWISALDHAPAVRKVTFEGVGTGDFWIRMKEFREGVLTSFVDAVRKGCANRQMQVVQGDVWREPLVAE